MAENNKKLTKEEIAKNTIAVQETILKAMENGISEKLDDGVHSSFVKDSYNAIVKNIESSKTVKVKVGDRYGNPVTSAGNKDMIAKFNEWDFTNDTLNYPFWLALYNDSWVFRRAIDKPAQDEVNSGFTLFGKHDYSAVYSMYDSYKNDLTQLLQWGALFGGSIAVMMFDGVPLENMSNPMDTRTIKGKKMKLYVTDRWYGVAVDVRDTVTDMKNVDFGKPKMYTVTFADGQNYKIHHSYILRYEHRTAPKLIKNGTLQGWGYAEGAHIFNELYRDEQLKNAISSLVNKCNLEIIKMAGMRGIFMGTDDGNQEQLMKRLEMVNWARNYNALTFLDKDDEYDRKDFSGFTGLSQLLSNNMWLISAALEMQGVLYGELKGGLSNDTNAYKHYAVTIKNRCDSLYRPVAYKLLKIIFLINDITDESPNFAFKSLNAIDDANTKLDSLTKLGNVLKTLEERGLISKYQSACTVMNYMNNETLTITFTEEHLNKLKLEEQDTILKTVKKLGNPDAGNDTMKEQMSGTPFGENVGGGPKEREVNKEGGKENPEVEDVPDEGEKEQPSEGAEAIEAEAPSGAEEAPDINLGGGENDED